MAMERKEAAFRTPAGLTARWTARGGRIVSLQGPDGREWLSRTSRSSIPAGAAFGDAEMAGWDECAPTIAPCAVDGVELPDHGDLWNARWRLDGATASVEGRALPYEFRRTASVAAEGALRFEYEARSLAGELPFLWAAHPQFQASAGTTVRLPDEAHVVEEHFPGPRRLERWTTRSGELGTLAPPAPAASCSSILTRASSEPSSCTRTVLCWPCAGRRPAGSSASGSTAPRSATRRWWRSSPRSVTATRSRRACGRAAPRASNRGGRCGGGSRSTCYLSGSKFPMDS